MRYIAGLCLYIASIAFGYWVEPMWELGSAAWFVIWTILGTLGLICLFWKSLKKTISLPQWLVLLIAVVVLTSSIVMYTRNDVVEDGAVQEEEELSENDKLVLEELRELHRVFEPADKGIHGMMLNTWAKPAKDDKEQGIRGLLNSYVVGPACAPGGGQLKIDLGLNPDSSASNQSSEHLQRLFGECFEKYQSLVNSAHWYLQVYMDVPLSTDPDYQRWRDEDKRFIDRLREIIPREEFATLRKTSENLITSGEPVRDSVTLSGNLLGHIIRIVYTKDRTASATAIVKRLSDLGADVKLGSPVDEIGPDVSVLHYYADPKLAIAVEIQKAIEDLLKVEIEKRTHPNNRRALRGVPLIGSSYDFTLYISEK